MGHPTLEYIKGLRKTLETKKAEIVGQNPSTIPGAEHDGKPDAAAKEPDKETKDQTMVPNSGLTTDGAGDDSKITHTNDLLAGEAALTPKKEPEVTGDADAAVPGGKTAEAKTEKTAEALAAEILTGVNAWYAAKKEAEAKKAEDGAAAAAPAGDAAGTADAGATAPAGDAGAATAPDAQKTAADTPPAAGEGTAEALITDKGKEPEQTKDVIPPAKKDEVTADAMVPATGEGSSGETAAAAKSAEGDAKEAECCKDGKCGKCAKCKAAAAAADKEKDAKCKAAKKCAGALDMELTSDVLAKIAAVMLATEEGTKLAESVLAKAAGAEAAEKTLNFLRAQNDLAQKQAEYKAGQRDALALILKKAQECKCDGGTCEGKCDDKGDGAAAVSTAPAAEAKTDDGGLTEIADTLDDMVEAGEITEDEADQVVVELAQAIAGAAPAAPTAPAADAGTAAQAAGEAKKEAQAVDPAAAAAAAPAADGNAAIDNTVAVDPAKLDPNSVPQGDLSDISPEDVASAIDTLVQSGEITEQEADQLVQEITGAEDAADAGAAAGDVSPEEIATALQDAVANGDIKPEDVQQVLTELEGVPAPAGDAGDAGAAAPAAAAVAPTDEPKTAGAKLLAAINAARAAKTAEANKASAK